MARRELFGEYLTALEPRRCRRRPDHTQSLCAKRFGDSRDQRGFRTYDGQFGSNRFSEACKTDRVIHIGGQACRYVIDAGVARRAVEFGCVRAAREFPCERMFAAPRADYEDSHCAAIV